MNPAPQSAPRRPGRAGSFPAALAASAALLAIILLGLVCRCWNYESVFADGAAFFADGDCCARMTRAASVYQRPGLVVRHHDFENWPDGVNPHTTAPLDYLIAGLARLARPLPPAWRLGAGELDFAGAITGPVLFVAGAFALLFAWPPRRPGRWIALAGFAAMPPVAWAGVLGRPDHQALLAPLLAVAFALSARWLAALPRALREGAASPWRWLGAGAGFCWGFAFWVSLYEPPILLLAGLAACAAAWLAARFAGARSLPAAGLARAALFPLTGAAPPLAGLLLIERPAITPPGASEAFHRWAKLIPELAAGSFNGLLSWMGWGAFVVALGLAAGLFQGKKSAARAAGSAAGLVMMAALVALYFWQSRWAPYAAMGLALLAPFALGSLLAAPAWTALPAGVKGALAAVCFAATVWHPAAEWDRLVFSAPSKARREEALADGIALRRIALAIRSEQERRGLESGARRGIIAPYWLCPALAYWSGAPAAGGVSHQSLPGILDTARFFAAPDWLAAALVLDRRQARWVVADVEERTVGTALVLLGTAPPSDPVGRRLEHFGRNREPDPDWLVERGRAGWFRWFEAAP